VQTDKIKTAWGRRTERVTEVVETSVKIKDAPSITWNGGPCRPYTIMFRHTRYDGGPWQSSVTIYALRPEAVVGNWFSPDQVYMPPQWLTDLIGQGGPDAGDTSV
jgi:hypothetical protein